MASPREPARRFCPACGRWTPGTFRTGPGARPDARCPQCRSLERQRFLALLTSCLSPVLAPVGTVLDIAPTAVTTTVLQELRPQRYLRMDIGHDPREVDVFGSVTAIPLADGSVDLLVCYHVLEHVADDAEAMREISRVLSSRGVALVQVPIKLGFDTDEDPSADEAERVRRFGQADHVRYYGDDFEDRLAAAGLVGSRICPETFAGLRACRTLGLIANEYVWVVRSATSPSPLAITPPTALVRTLDATLDGWGADLGKLDRARERVRRLTARADRHAARPSLPHRLRRRMARRR